MFGPMLCLRHGRLRRLNWRRMPTRRCRMCEVLRGSFFPRRRPGRRWRRNVGRFERALGNRNSVEHSSDPPFPCDVLLGDKHRRRVDRVSAWPTDFDVRSNALLETWKAAAAELAKNADASLPDV